MLTHELQFALESPNSVFDDIVRRSAAAYVRERCDTGLTPDLLTRDNIREIAALYAPLSSVEKIDRFLRLLARDTPFPGAGVKRGQDEVYAIRLRVTTKEVAALRRFLGESGLISLTSDPYYLTPMGWQKVWQVQEAGLVSRRAFVAMWFDGSLEAAWDGGIRPGIEDAQCEAVRVDKVHHNEKICDRIVSEIRGCGFLVADVTGHRQGVYFEAGLALGLGKPVIWTCRKDALEDAHFDTRQYNHIAWERPADLRTQLADRIKATLLPNLPGHTRLER